QVCNMGLFGNDIIDLWIGSLDDLSKISCLQKPHQNSFYTVLMVENATGKIVIDNISKQINPFEIITISSDIINQIHIIPPSTGKIVCFSEDFFSVRYNDNMLNQFSIFENGFQTAIRFSEADKNAINTILNLMCNEFYSDKRDSKKVLRSYLNILLVEIERLHKPIKSNKIRGYSKEKAYKFQKLIEKHYKTDKLPSDYAQRLNVSTNYLNKISKEHFGLSSGAVIRKKLVLEAKRILHYTHSSIGEVAFQLGFDYVSYFVSFFKKQTGETPEQYRKQQQGY